MEERIKGHNSGLKSVHTVSANASTPLRADIKRLDFNIILFQQLVGCTRLELPSKQ